MIVNFFKKNSIRKDRSLVEPDEIFLDSKNIQNFDRQQFEGRIERTISKKTIFWVGVFFLILSGVFFLRLGYLQISRGEAYFQRSEQNTLAKQYIFADRGIFYDRHGVELAWNKKVETKEFPWRAYISPGFSHVF